MILSALVILIFTALLSWFCVGRLRHILLANNIVDQANERSMHEGQVPRGGGLVIVMAMLIALLALSISSARPTLFLGLWLTVLLWSALSWWDDQHDLSPKLRLILQMAFTLFMVSAFGWIDTIQLSMDLRITLDWLGAVLTFIGILWLANLYNFMDGMDGLAAAQTIIASLTLSFWFWALGDVEIALLCLVIAGASYGFLLWNWRPAKIFMGDVASVTLGAFFACLIIIGSSRFDIPVISMVMLFGVFVADATVTMLRRISKFEKFWLPHRQHCYQRLGLAGMAHEKIVVLSILAMVFCSLLATLSLIYRDTILICLGVLCFSVVFVIIGVNSLERMQNTKPNNSQTNSGEE